MIALKNILVPTDFSECANAAVRYGRELAEHFGARLHLLHVVQDPYRYAWGVESVPLTGYDFVEQWQRSALENLQKSVPDAAKPFTTTSCPIGLPVDEIVRYAREHEIGLIVLGTHGRGAVAHVFLGSVAERVVRKSPCPVLTVHHLQHEFIQEPAATAQAVAAG
jgi:nucleotide-binding universal stress UspA family protein